MIYCCKSDVGIKRISNEDSFGSYVCEESNLGFFIVADGMGGHNAGEIASNIAVEHFLLASKEYKSTREDKDITSFAKETLIDINRSIYTSASFNEDYYGMGTTSVLSIITEKTIIVANVGDSRAYLLSESGNRQITIDHSYIEDLIRTGVLDRSLAKNHPDRNIITRALGLAPEISVDTFEVAYKLGDLLIMCSDGLNSMVNDEEIYKIASLSNSPEIICNMLINEAKQNGGNDNITVIVAKL